MRVFLNLIFCISCFFLCLQANAQTGAFNDQKTNLQINDLYAFNSYETGRNGFVTVIANYAQSSDGEIFFDPNAKYEIHIDSDGNGIENQTYRFSFKQELKETVKTINIAGQEISIPFLSSGNIQTDNGNNLQRKSFEVELVRKKPSYTFRSSGPNRKNSGKKLRIAGTKTDEFEIPENNIDSTSFTDYDSYANDFIYDLNLRFKKCKETAKVFVGQRQASFQGNLSGIKNNLDYDFLGTNGATSSSAGENVMSIALELPKSCLDLPKNNSTIAVWTSIQYPARVITKSKAKFGKNALKTQLDFVQLDRMGHPFVNEFLIGYDNQVTFEQLAVRKDEKKFLSFFEYPAFAQMIDTATSFSAPTALPRTDLTEFYLSGITGINQFTENKKAKKQRNFEALRLDTSSTAVTAVSQNSLGLIGSDNAGYPNGRRPGDDVVDIFFRTLMGFFVDDIANAPDKNTTFSDGVDISASDFKTVFPYLNSPN